MKKTLYILLCMTLLIPLMPILGFADDDGFYYECEAEDGIVNGYFEKIEDPEASGGMAMCATTTNTAVTGGANGSAPLTFTFEAPKAGTYTFFIRYESPFGNADSLFFAFNDEDYQVLWTLKIEEGFKWTKFYCNLTEGENTLYLRHRKKDFRVDKVIVTNVLGFAPTGTGGEVKGFWAKPDYNAGETIIEGFSLPPYIPTEGHPRVMVNAEDLSKIRSNLKHPENIKSYERILTCSDFDASEAMLEPVDNPKQNNFNGRGIQYINSNAFLYMMHGDKARGRKAIEGTIAFMKNLNTQAWVDNTIRSRNVGFTLYTAAQTYDWCYDLLTEEEKKSIIETGVQLLSVTEYGWPPTEATEKVYAAGHSTEIDFQKVALAFGIAVYDEYPGIYNTVAGWLMNEFIPYRNYLYDGGTFHTQYYGYGGFRFTLEIQMAWLLDKAGIPRGIFSPNMKNRMYGHTLTRMPNGAYFRLDDAAVSQTYGGNADAHLLLASYYKDPFQKQEYWKIMNGNNDTAWDYAGLGPTEFILVNDVDLGLDSIEKMPLTDYFGNMTGTMVARTSWDMGLDSNSMVAFLHMPEKFFKGHQHYINGSFQIYYKGYLAMNTGEYHLYLSPHDAGYNKQTIAANCMLIYNPANDKFYTGNYSLMGGQMINSNNLDFYTSFKNATGEKTDWGKILGYDYGEDAIKPSYSYLKGDISKAYNGNANIYTRTFVFLNFFDSVYPGALIVFDKVDADASYKRTWLLHSEEEPTINGTTSTIRRTDNGNDGRLVNKTLLPKENDALITKVGGKGKEFLVGSTNYPANDPSIADYGQWRVEVTSKSTAQVDYYLNVLQTASNSQNPEPLEATYLESGDYAGVQIKDRVAYLSKYEAKNSNDVIVKTADNSEGDFTFMVDNLMAGQWNVLKDGQVIASKNVTEEGGTVCFTAPAGTYTLSIASTKWEPKEFDYTKLIDNSVDAGIYLSYNGRYYSFDTPIKEINGTPYVPVDEFVTLMQGTIAETEADLHITTPFGEGNIPKEHLTTLYDKAYAPFEDMKVPLSMDGTYKAHANILRIWQSTPKQTIVVEKDKIVNHKGSNVAQIVRVQSTVGDPSPIVDGDPVTEWLQQGTGFELTFEFAQPTTIQDYQIKWRQADTRRFYYELYVSDDGENFTKIYDGVTSGKTAELDSMGGTPFTAKFVKIIANGNSNNEWNGISDIVFYK